MDMTELHCCFCDQPIVRDHWIGHLIAYHPKELDYGVKHPDWLPMLLWL